MKLKEWYDVSLSQPGEGEWDEPVSVLAISPARAAEERLESDAKFCDDWLEHDWDAHVRVTGNVGSFDWYYRLEKPKRIIETTATEYFPSNTKGES